jgi:flagellar hook-basal body complex protein FliE
MEIKNQNHIIYEPVRNPFIDNSNNTLIEDTYTDFVSFLKNAISDVNRYQLESTKLDELFASGATDNIHEVMIAAEKAEIALQFTLEIKNKIMDAYREIMRLQV